MDYVFAIPSHNRAKTLSVKTLQLLNRHNIPHDLIYVFCHSSCLEAYALELPPSIKLIESWKGVAQNRMFISNYFKEGQKIIWLDDDIDEIYELKDGKAKPLHELNSLIDIAFTNLEKENAGLCGITPTYNPYYMRPTFTNDLKFCIGQMRFTINDRFCERRKFEALEDYETTLKYYFKYNKVLRFNYIGVKANYLTGVGGMSDTCDRSYENKKLECQKFVKKYPRYAMIVDKGTRCDIRFKSKHRKDTIQTLWIGEMNELSTLAIQSWLCQGYNVDVYTDIENIYDPLLQDPRITQKDARDIMYFKEIDNILPFSDLWRYNLLYKKGGIWLDADMVLIDQLPQDDIIISSEYTMQSGAYKSKLPYVPNIGVLKFPKKTEMLKIIINKINSRRDNARYLDNMRVFQQVLKNNILFKSVVYPNVFCPLSWWDAKQAYTEKKYRSKYAVEPLSNDTMLDNAIGIHLWNNFTYNKWNIDFSNIELESLYNRLYCYVNNGLKKIY